MSLQTELTPGADIHHIHNTSPQAETVLTFKLADETFGISVGMVAEIIDPQKTTRVPNANALAPTLINVRGSIVPVIDLRFRLGMRPAEQIHTTRMLVLETKMKGETAKLAVMVDEVEDVIDTTTGELDTVPELGIRWPADCFRGVAKRDDTLVILIDADNAFALPVQ